MIDLRGKYIKYDETITEDVFDRIVYALLSGQCAMSGVSLNYKVFKMYGNLCIRRSDGLVVGCTNPKLPLLEQIKVSDILGEGWDNKSFTQTLIEEEQESIRRNLKLYLDMNPPIEVKDELWYKKLKKGDFVVSLTDYFPDSTRMKDYVFFIEEDFDQPHRQNLADRIHYIGMSSGSCSSYSVEEFRLATQQEKELYLAFGKPVHINTPLPKDNASTSLKQASNELLLEEARRRYPVGTMYDHYGVICTVCGDFILYEYNDGVKISDGYGGSVYDRGVWSNIEQLPTQPKLTYEGCVVHVETKKQPVLLDSFEPIKVNEYKDVNINNLI